MLIILQIYVLVNYLTVGGYPHKGYTWPAQCHVIGKDILKYVSKCITELCKLFIFSQYIAKGYI